MHLFNYYHFFFLSNINVIQTFKINIINNIRLSQRHKRILFISIQYNGWMIGLISDYIDECIVKP